MVTDTVIAAKGGGHAVRDNCSPANNKLYALADLDLDGDGVADSSPTSCTLTCATGYTLSGGTPLGTVTCSAVTASPPPAEGSLSDVTCTGLVLPLASSLSLFIACCAGRTSWRACFSSPAWVAAC